MGDRLTVISNLVDVCQRSPDKTDVLKAVRKAKSYQQVAHELGKDATYCSRVLNELLANDLVQQEGKRGVFRQTPIVTKLNIDSELKSSAQRSGKPIRIILKKGMTTVRFSDDFEIPNPGLPESVVQDARKMVGVYPYLYLFENSVRYSIIQTMESNYGKDWWKEKVSGLIQKKAGNRLEKEGRNRWHGKRGQHPIFYVDIDDLRSIIASNEKDFKSRFPDVKRPLEWVQQRIEEIEFSRNVVAHNNPLSDDDIARLKLYFKDWAKQMGSKSA